MSNGTFTKFKVLLDVIWLIVLNLIQQVLFLIFHRCSFTVVPLQGTLVFLRELGWLPAEQCSGRTGKNTISQPHPFTPKKKQMLSKPWACLPCHGGWVCEINCSGWSNVLQSADHSVYYWVWDGLYFPVSGLKMGRRPVIFQWSKITVWLEFIKFFCLFWSVCMWVPWHKRRSENSFLKPVLACDLHVDSRYL